MLIARVLVVPPPNHLYGESAEFLRKLMQGLRRQYEGEMRAETPPQQVADLMVKLPQELFRRRRGGGRTLTWGEPRVCLMVVVPPTLTP